MRDRNEIVEVMLPKLGESIVGATVVQWLKSEGEKVAVDEPLLEVATDKVNSEIPSPVSGILKEICVKIDQEIEVGHLLARVETISADSPKYVAQDMHPSTSSEASAPAPKEEFLSPAVLCLAQSEGISLETLRKMDGTGIGGRITKKDVQRFIESRISSGCQKEPPTMVEVHSEERIAMSCMRRAIAENMVRSFYEAPHASLIIEADVSDVMKVIAQEKERFLQAHGVKLTITTFLVQALAKAIGQFPMLNASLDQETIILKRYVNVGIAVNIDKGLVVPVIKNCQERNLMSIAKAIAELGARARSGKLLLQEMQEGTITLTNFGMTGALVGIPIIRYPEVAIIGAGSVQKKVVVREDDSLAIRQMLNLTLTFDHRVIDGIYGCQFLAAFKSHLESFKIDR